MRIFIIGEFLSGRIEIFYKEAFQSLGFKLHCFNTGAPNRLQRVYWQQLINRRILKAISDFKPDLVLVFKGFYLIPKTILEIKKRQGCLVFCFNGDNPFNLHWGASNRNILNSIPYYDCYFTFSHLLLEPLKRAGVRYAEVLEFGYAPNVHYPVELLSEEKKVYSNDITFIGSWDREREYWLKTRRAELEAAGIDVEYLETKLYLNELIDS